MGEAFQWLVKGMRELKDEMRKRKASKGVGEGARSCLPAPGRHIG